MASPRPVPGVAWSSPTECGTPACSTCWWAGPGCLSSCTDNTRKAPGLHQGPSRPGYPSQRIHRSGVPAMKLNYHPDTDSLYIDLSERPSVESREISEGVVLDYDAQGNLVGIDIDNASRKVQLKELILSKLPGKVQTIAAWRIAT